MAAAGLLFVVKLKGDIVFLKKTHFKKAEMLHALVIHQKAIYS